MLLEIKRGNVKRRGGCMGCSVPSKRVWRMTVWKPGPGIKSGTTAYRKSGALRLCPSCARRLRDDLKLKIPG